MKRVIGTERILVGTRIAVNAAGVAQQVGGHVPSASASDARNTLVWGKAYTQMLCEFRIVLPWFDKPKPSLPEIVEIRNQVYHWFAPSTFVFPSASPSVFEHRSTMPVSRKRSLA